MPSNIYKISHFKPAGIVYGISTRFYGNMKDKKNMKKFLQDLGVDGKKLILSKQQHSSNVNIFKNGKNSLIGIDGHLTQQKNVFLGVVTADCLPVLFYDAKLEIVGVAHAGYKGLMRGILIEMTRKMKNLGSMPKNIQVAIGPGILGCCYNVPKDRIDAFKNLLPKKKFYTFLNNKYMLDMQKIAVAFLTQVGIPKKNIALSNTCTKCNILNFFSYRGDSIDTFGEFLTVIGKA